MALSVYKELKEKDEELSDLDNMSLMGGRDRHSCVSLSS